MPAVYPVYLTADDVDGALSNIIPLTAAGMYPGAFPGYAGEECINNAEVDSYPMTASRNGGEWVEASVGEHTDFSVGAEMGDVNQNPYTIGSVEPNMVENFALLGRVLNNPRQAEYGHGQVGDLDYLSYTAQQLAAQEAPEAVADQVLAALLTGGGMPVYPGGDF